MNVLVVCMEVGKSAVGIVVERLIYGLEKHYNTFVLTNSFSPSINLEGITLLRNKHYYRLPGFVWRVLSKFRLADKHGSIYLPHWRILRKIKETGLNRFYNKRYCNNALHVIQKQDVKFDVIISIVSSFEILPISVGSLIKNKIQTKLIVYTVDAIPSPEEWEPDLLVVQEQKELLSEGINNVDIFYAANNQMLQYEKRVLNIPAECETGVLYTPSLLSEVQVYPKEDSKDFVICYTGSIYGKRNVNPLLVAMNEIIKERNDVYLWFIGSGTEKSNHLFLSDMQRRHIKFFPAVDDLSEYYKASSCLLNIDADLDNDVFLSSKIINYLYVNRPILNITGKNSVSGTLFQYCESIFHCNNTSADIVKTIKQILMAPNFSVSDRASFVKLMNIETIISSIHI